MSSHPASLPAALSGICTVAFAYSCSPPHTHCDSHLGAFSLVISYSEKVTRNMCLTEVLSIFNIEKPHKKSED